MTLEIPWLCWKWLLTMGCVLSQPQSRSELWLDLVSYLSGIEKRGGEAQVKGVMGYSQAKLSKFGSYFGPILLSLVAPCWFLKVHRVLNFYFWTYLNVLQGFFQSRSLLGEVNQATGIYKIREKGLNLLHFAIKSVALSVQCMCTHSLIKIC